MKVMLTLQNLSNSTTEVDTHNILIRSNFSSHTEVQVREE